jgi:hypothetical protein
MNVNKKSSRGKLCCPEDKTGSNIDKMKDFRFSKRRFLEIKCNQ